MKTIFEEKFEDGPSDSEPLFSIDWVDARIIGGFVLFFVGVLMQII